MYEIEIENDMMIELKLASFIIKRTKYQVGMLKKKHLLKLIMKKNILN